MRLYTDKFLAPIFDNIPAGLKECPWAVWTAEPRPNKPGKFNKAPRSPETGRKIGADKPHLFGTYEQAVTAYETGKYTGLGVLLTGDGLIGVDIDEVNQTFVDQPNVRAWVIAAIRADAYCETSPSGTGLRLFMLGNPLPDNAGRRHGHLEIYDDVRFLTVTGHLLHRGGDHA